MPAPITPLSLDLKKDSHLEILWSDGQRCVYKIDYLRTMCPCAQCRTVRAEDKPKTRLSLQILPGNFSQKLEATGAELVGNYALRIDWSDDHGSGIYSFQYLREIMPKKNS